MSNTEKKPKEYVITDETIKQIMAIAGKEAVKAYKSENAKANKQKIQKTKELLENYRSIKAAVEDDKEFTIEEQIELKWKFIEELMGARDSVDDKTERIMSDEEKKRQENLYCLNCIDKAIGLYKEECENYGKPEAVRRYRIIEQHYLADKKIDIKEISSREKISQKSVYRDIGIATRIIAVYLLGADFR